MINSQYRLVLKGASCENLMMYSGLYQHTLCITQVNETGNEDFSPGPWIRIIHLKLVGWNLNCSLVEQAVKVVKEP